jgi:predicted ArsR family transcriptional regulator
LVYSSIEPRGDDFVKQKIVIFATLPVMSEPGGLGTSKRRIVDHLKREGGCTTADLAAVLGVTTQAVRAQLTELETQGLVVAETIATGARGRPPQGWALSSRAMDLFPDRHGELAVELLDAIRATSGDEGVAAVLAQRERAQLEAFGRAVPPGSDLGTRVELLARHRSDQGYMAEVLAEGDDLLLVEHHCPVCAAATACQGLCANELDLFRDAVGPGADIERTQHLLSGGERCVYRIRPRS